MATNNKGEATRLNPAMLWREMVPRDHAFHVSVALDERRMPIPIHGHDFAEVCWVVEGKGWHRINGARVKMRVGDLCMIRPTDRHGLGGEGEGRFRLENVAFTKATLRRMRTRYFPQIRDWFWREGRFPFSGVLDARQMERLTAEIAWLRQAPRDVFSIDCFLLQLFRILGRRDTAEASLPDWLERALRSWDGVETLQPGLKGFYRLAGRSPGHVSRVMVKTCGKTPSAWVNEKRVERAARLLESTGLSVTEVSAEVGFESLSYFHRLFRGHYGVPPLRYRRRVRAVM